MSGHTVFNRPEHEFEDSAFEPRSSFDFDEEVNHLGHDMAGLHAYPGEGFDFDLMNGEYEEDEQLEHGFLHDRSGSMTSANSFAQNLYMSNANQTGASRKDQISGNLDVGARSGAPVPLSGQGSIVNSRKENVRQQFGQITPPNEGPGNFNAPPPKRTQTHQSGVQENGKLTNEQRARNAANTRHSRSKTTKKKGDPNNSNSDEEGTQKQGKNITLQREKNRVAAAKCRAKKKSANEQQEELASEFGATNNYLTREIRDLKNQKTELQNFLLAHRPGVCDCHGIHDYNIGQAQRLVLNARRHVAEPASSPSRESALSTQSPGSEASGTGMFSAPSEVPRPETLEMPSRHTSFSGPMNYAFSQGMDPERQANTNSAIGGHHMSHEFAEFLQSSPDNRAGFS